MEFYCGQDGNLIWKLDVAKMTLFVADMTRRFSFWPIPYVCSAAPVTDHQNNDQFVTGHLSEGSFVRNRVVQILKFDAKPNHNHNPNSNPNAMPICFGQMTLQSPISLSYSCHLYNNKLLLT